MKRGKYREVAGVLEKCCPSCKEWKPSGLEHFLLKQRLPDGRIWLSSWCRVCSRRSVARSRTRTPEVILRYAEKSREYKRRAWREGGEAMRARKNERRRARLAQEKERRMTAQEQKQQAINRVDTQLRRGKLSRPRAATLVLDILTRGWGV